MRVRCGVPPILALLALFFHPTPHAVLSAGSSFPTAAGSATADLPPVFLATWGTNGTAERQFARPGGVAMDRDGNVYVADTDNHRIQKLDSQGNFLRMWGWGVDTGSIAFEVCSGSCLAGISGSGNGQLDEPHGLAVNSLGMVYVADTNNHRIQVFTQNGAYLSHWGANGTDEAKFKDPWGVAIDASDNIFVADQGNHRIQKFDNTATFVMAWGWGVDDQTEIFQVCTSQCYKGDPGTGAGQFTLPASLAVDSSDNVYVADTGQSRIQKFDATPAYLTLWGSLGSGSLQYWQPHGIAVDYYGSVHVADTGNHRIKVHDSSGGLRVIWGTAGADPGKFHTPGGLAVDERGHVLVADTQNHRIQKFGPAFDVFVGEEALLPGR